ncbi:DoxX family membrane protein [Arthrobacter gyeryongensis]|uniref:DoxX family membrane protein n=1 Tax=Arthrobacter gyeryongensis TaxID=1650592 RepID=A0ABP9S0Z5_9MICC
MAATSIPVPADGGISRALHRARVEPAYAAFLTLLAGFVVLPIVFGLDKFTNLLTNWEGYLAPWLVALLPFSAHTAMLIVGVVEIVAGILIAIKPRYAAYVVAFWLAGIIINLLTYSGFYDVALRDFGLLVAALALAQLARTYDHGSGRQDHANAENRSR